MLKISIYVFFIGLFSYNQCKSQTNEKILAGAYQLNEYIHLLKGKNVGLTINHSSLIENTHLIDTLQSLAINITKVFTPEHGFTGSVSNGLEVEYDSMAKPYKLISLYGKNKKPTLEQLSNLDILIFDIQDVGVRFYTYISTMHYVMEACSEANLPVLILDRPNPNGSYVDGPVLDTAFRSFVGMHPIPIVYGMTMGELAQMINNEGWLANKNKANLTIIRLKNWDHETAYPLPVNPSPNLPNNLSISLYPSLCLFEGTIMSVGRGTDYAFQQIGHPDYPNTTYSFIPTSKAGAKWPPYEDMVCYGESWIGNKPINKFTLQPLLNAYKKMDHTTFFNSYFKRLAGTDSLQKQIEKGMSEEEIRKTWETSLNQFKQKRLHYLLY